MKPRSRRTLSRVGATALLAGTLAGGLLGCEADSWWDPSVVGRWEHTPTVVPILERIDVIERDSGDFVETTEVTADDLIPEIADYQIGAGDTLGLEVWDIVAPGVPTAFERTVDGHGQIELPQVGKVQVIGLTPNQAEDAVIEALREAQLIEDALVSIIVTGQRQSTFSVFGQVPRVGRYLVPTSDYRILEAMTEAGGVSPATRYIYLIRQVPLSQRVRGGSGSEVLQNIQAPTPEPTDGAGDDDGPSLIDLIDQLTEPEAEGEEDGLGLLDALDDDISAPGAFGGGSEAAPAALNNVWAQIENGDPPIDLIELDDADDPVTNPAGPALSDDQDTGGWMFLNGEWVRVTRRSSASGLTGLPEGEDPLASSGDAAEELVTQRIIKIPVEPLIQGVAKYNIVVRPGDIIRVPGPEQGLVYLGGPGIARPGTYNLPIFGRLTLTKAVISAGGLSPIAIPTRVDLTRMVGEDRQATIRLNLAAISAGTHPDIFLKPDDVVNLGTTLWARPLAVVRNGFRMSYGFGFLLDRNFGNDVFGPPPTNFRQ